MTLACKYNKACQWARLVVWLNLNILAHLAHLAQSYFSLIFSAFNTYNCSWFNLTNKKNCSDWRQKLGEKWSMLTTFFLAAIAAITGIWFCFTCCLSFISGYVLYAVFLSYWFLFLFQNDNWLFPLNMFLIVPTKYVVGDSHWS